ncbi:MAG: LytTR family transcriptional regulator [Bacteroidales bacterium]|nr:LytTR family transcriptional regulator [Bacteroidales bacterium]
MSILTRKYPFLLHGHWAKDCLIYSLIVVGILYFLQPFGFNGFGGNKLLAVLIFGAVTFCCCALYGQLIFHPLQRRARVWRIWHQALGVLGMVLFIGICNYFTFSLLFKFPLKWEYFWMFLCWTLIIGVVVTVCSTSIDYFRFLRGRLDALLDKTTQEQESIRVAIHDTRVRGNDLSLPINDLLYIEAQKNNVAVCYRKDGKLVRDEIQSTLAGVLDDLAEYGNIFQCHRSFVVNLNNITSAKGNSNGYTLELGGGLATVPVSRSFVPKLKSFIA